MHTLSPKAKLAALLATFRSVYHSVRGKDMAPLLALRSFVAFALPGWDYVFWPWLSELGIKSYKCLCAKRTRQRLHSPAWTSLSFLHLPLHAGGVGSPDLPTRNLALLFLAYLQATASRNPLS